MFCNTFGNSRMTIPAPAVYFRLLSHVDVPCAWDSTSCPPQDEPGAPLRLLWAFTQAGRAGLQYLGRPAGGLLPIGNGFKAEDSSNSRFWILENKFVPLGEKSTPLTMWVNHLA